MVMHGALRVYVMCVRIHCSAVLSTVMVVKMQVATKLDGMYQRENTAPLHMHPKRQNVSYK